MYQRIWNRPFISIIGTFSRALNGLLHSAHFFFFFFSHSLTNFYQNHRRYVKSRDDTQLRGNIEPYNSVASNCDPIVSRDGSEEQKDVYFPCGLIAWSMFNDTFQLDGVTLQEHGIAWPSDVNSKFRMPEGNVSAEAAPIAASGPLSTFNITDEHFIVWMRTAALPDFRKLWAVLPDALPAGTYTLRIDNQFPVAAFGGTKSVVLATTSWLGGKNPFLGIAYMVVGAVALLQAVLFLLKHLLSPRKLVSAAFVALAHTRHSLIDSPLTR